MLVPAAPDPDGMSRNHRSNRHHLRLIQGEAQDVITPFTRAPSPSRLAHNVVRAAQQWAAAALSGALPFDPSTSDGQLLLALLDSVQDMEYHLTNPTAITVSAEWIYQGTLNMEPGTPGA